MNELDKIFSHSENSGRLKAIQEKIESSKVYSHLHFPEPRRATDDELAANHDIGHIGHVRNSCRNGRAKPRWRRCYLPRLLNLELQHPRSRG